MRPNAFAQAEIDRIRQIIHPDFECLYQQLRGAKHSIKIDAAHFGKSSAAPKNAAVVISVDPGHRGGAGHSFTVMQAWTNAWTLNGRILRPAMVVVAKAPAGAQAAEKPAHLDTTA